MHLSNVAVKSDALIGMFLFHHQFVGVVEKIVGGFKSDTTLSGSGAEPDTQGVQHLNFL
jgi:hypothetical protein